MAHHIKGGEKTGSVKESSVWGAGFTGTGTIE